MKRMNTYLTSVAALFLCFGATVAAQERRLTAQQTEPGSQTEPIHQTSRQLNAADMECYELGDGYGQAALGADFETGTFHRAQDAATKTGIFFNAEGERQVGRFRLKGDFRFRQSFENGVNFASTFNPLRAMPYVIADSTGGNWQKQAYSMWTDISTPIVKGVLNAGLALDLDVGRGAKKIDPRPQAGMCRIEIKPSLSFLFRDYFSVSAGFIYALYRETSNLILYDSSQPQKIYLLKGLGQYTTEVFSSTERERKYDGNTLGGSFCLQFRKDRLRASLWGDYRNGLEKVYDIDYNKPHDRGNLYTHDFRLGLDAYAPNELLSRIGYEGGFTYEGSRHSGREFVQHFDSSPEVNGWVTDSELPGRYTNAEDHFGLALGLYVNDRNTFRRDWKITLRGEVNSFRQEYRATGAKETIKDARASAELAKRIGTRVGQLDLSLTGTVSRSLGSRLDYTPREIDDPNISTDLIEHDFSLPSNWYGAALDISHSWKLKKCRAISLEGRAFIRESGRDIRSKESCGLDVNNTPGLRWRSGGLVGVRFRF